MAHLLNHSCEPNCYSRLTGVWDEVTGSAVQHVVLYAKTPIAADVELTYDYRCAGLWNTEYKLYYGLVAQRKGLFIQGMADLSL